MLKTLGALLGGVFVGAAGMELLRRKYPEGLDALYARLREVGSGAYERTGRMTSGAREAFWEGYGRATGPEEGPEPSV